MEKYGKYILIFFSLVTVFVIYKFVIKSKYSEERQKYLKLLDERFKGFKSWIDKNDANWKSELQRKAFENKISYEDQVAIDFAYDLIILRKNILPGNITVPAEFTIEYKNSLLTDKAISL